MTRFELLAISASLLMITGCQSAETPDIGVKPPVASAADLGRRIERLASDEFEGRAPGTPGGQAASQYIANEMKAAGLVPMGKNGTYFQPVQLTETEVLPTSSSSITGGARIMTAVMGKNTVFWTKRLKESQTIEDSDIIFVGYGIIAPEYDWNDYAGLDVKGKTVVMLVNDPGFATKDENLFKGNAMTYYGRWTYKYEEAGRQGAAAVLVIHETEPASYGWDVVSGSWSGAQYDLVRPDGGSSRAILEGWLHYESAKRLFSEAGLDIVVEKAKAVTNDFKPVALKGMKLNATINQNVKTVESRNVAGGVIGTTRPDEYVLYMAHWDHLGKNENTDGEDKIFNGAVDNATGVAAIIEIGEAFVQQGAPERSAIFVAVTAEESGLLGSAYYAEDPLVPLKTTVAGINIDAILPLGKTKDMKVIGFGASELEDRLKDVLDPRGMYIVPDDKPEAGYYYRSDHISLAKKGVPMLYSDPGNDHVVNRLTYGEDFAKDYTKERYHKPGDEYDNSWDLSGIEQSTEILFKLGYGIANSKDWPNWYDGTEFRALRDEMLK
jgi:Zn-dependent M28 family amino/carboxypeptidase